MTTMIPNKDNKNLISNNKSPDRPQWQNLFILVFAFVFLPLSILVLVVAFGSTNLHQNAMRNLVGERDVRAARSVGNAINAQLLHRADLIQSLAIRGREEADLDSVLDSSPFLDQEFDMGLAFLTPDGTLITKRDDSVNWESLLEDIATHLDDSVPDLNPNIWFTNAIPYRDSENYVLLIYAKTGNSDPIAIGAFSVASIAYQPLNSAFNPGQHAVALLVDADQRVVFSIGEPLPDHITSDHPGVSEALTGESGAVYFQVNDTEHVTAYSPVPLLEWGIVLEEPWESVTNPLLNTTLLAPLALVPVLILTLLALWFGASRIIRPLQSLEHRAAKLAWGDYQAIEKPVDGIEEINRLQRTLIHMAHKVKVAQQGLRGYISAITTGQEEERQRLARELHDDTIQSLIALKQRVQLTNVPQGDQEVGDKLQEIQNMADETIRNLRRITKDLRPTYLEDLGLVATLEMLTTETSNTIDVPVEFQSIGLEQRFSPEVELSLYRMAQEGFSNIARHAKATHASIIIDFSQQSTTITISDDGQGFVVPESPADFVPSGHYGLLGLHERAELIGAKLEILSALQHGTQLVIIFPSPRDDAKSEEEALT
jgi:two-component system sensor histidine kinase UhpB